MLTSNSPKYNSPSPHLIPKEVTWRGMTSLTTKYGRTQQGNTALQPTPTGLSPNTCFSREVSEKKRREKKRKTRSNMSGPRAKLQICKKDYNESYAICRMKHQSYVDRKQASTFISNIKKSVNIKWYWYVLLNTYWQISLCNERINLIIQELIT